MPNTTTLAAGATATIGLAAGSILRLSGMGTAQLAPPAVRGASTQRAISPAQSTFGPYEVAVTVNVVAGASGVRYYTQATSDAAPAGTAQSGGEALSASEVAQSRALVSTPGNSTAAALVASASQGATLFVASDSILAQSFDPPNNLSNFVPTTAKGSYYNSSAVKTTGVSNIYAENPCRLGFRVAHNLVTGDEVYLDELASNHPLSSKRYTVTVIDSTTVTLNGIDGTSVPTLTSASATTDAMAYIDMSMGDYGPLTYMLHELGYPFSKIDGVMRPGATSAQLAAAIGTQWPAGPYTHGVLLIGRNDASYDAASLALLRDAMVARCGWVLVCLPHPDATSGGYTAGSLAKLKSIAAFWYDAQASYAQIKVCDLFGVISDPTATLEAALSGLLGSDNVHPQATGARRIGEKMAADFPEVSLPRRALARNGSGGSNLLASGRFTGGGGTVGSGVTALVASASVATGFTIGRKSTNGTCIAQLWQLPAIARRPGTAYAVNQVLDVGDGWWYVVKTAGTTATGALPAGYASAVLFDSTTGVTDGTANVYRIPQFSTSRDALLWQYMALGAATDGGRESMSFFQSIALPGTVAVGDYVQARIDVAFLGGFTKDPMLRLTANSVAPAQLAAGIAFAPNNLQSQAPAAPIRVKTIQTPRIRVPANTATLELEFKPFIPVDGVWLAVSLPVIEEVSAPGTVG